MWLLVASLSLMGCKDRMVAEEEPASEPAVTPVAPIVDNSSVLDSYILQQDRVLRISEAGAEEALLTVPKAAYCQVDARSQVIWLLSETGISLLDLTNRKHTQLVPTAEEPIEAFEVRFGDDDSLGNADGVESDAVALIVMALSLIHI